MTICILHGEEYKYICCFQTCIQYGHKICEMCLIDLHESHKDSVILLGHYQKFIKQKLKQLQQNCRIYEELYQQVHDYQQIYNKRISKILEQLQDIQNQSNQLINQESIIKNQLKIQDLSNVQLLEGIRYLYISKADDLKKIKIPIDNNFSQINAFFEEISNKMKKFEIMVPNTNNKYTQNVIHELSDIIQTQFSNDYKQMFSVYDVDSFERVAYEQSKQKITSFSGESLDDRWIAKEDGKIQKFFISDGRILIHEKFTILQQEIIIKIQLVDSQTMTTLSINGKIQIFNLNQRKIIPQIHAIDVDCFDQYSLNDKSYLAIIQKGQHLNLWDMKIFKQISFIQLKDQQIQMQIQIGYTCKYLIQWSFKSEMVYIFYIKPNDQQLQLLTQIKQQYYFNSISFIGQDERLILRIQNKFLIISVESQEILEEVTANPCRQFQYRQKQDAAYLLSVSENNVQLHTPFRHRQVQK